MNDFTSGYEIFNTLHMVNEDTAYAFNRLKRLSLQFIPEKDFERIEKGSVNLRFQKGEVVLKQGNTPSHVLYLETGIVKFSYETETKRNLILTVVSAPKILGGANLFYKDNNLFSIIAVEPCEVLLIDAQVLLGVLQTNARFAIMLFQFASEMFKSSIMNFISLAHKQKESRIADVIRFLAGNVYHENTFRLSLTRREIAEFAGCSTENVIMTMRRWQHEGIIECNGRDLTILDEEKLTYISKIG